MATRSCACLSWLSVELTFGPGSTPGPRPGPRAWGWGVGLLAQSFSPETWGRAGVLACPEKGPSASLDERGQGDIGQRVQGCEVP